VLAGMVWALENPQAGIVEADEMDFRAASRSSAPISGPSPASTPTGPRSTPAPGFFPEDIDPSDPWQFRNVLVR
jgi:homospermidine synthase